MSIYLIQESYGFQYEDHWDYILGYYDNIEDAQRHKQQLEDAYATFGNSEASFNEEEDKLREATDDSEEGYEIYDKALKELEEKYGYKDCYTYDWYSVSITEVQSLS